MKTWQSGVSGMGPRAIWRRAQVMRLLHEGYRGRKIRKALRELGFTLRTIRAVADVYDLGR